MNNDTLIDVIAEVQANGWEYGTHPRDKARIVLEAIQNHLASPEVVEYYIEPKGTACPGTEAKAVLQVMGEPSRQSDGEAIGAKDVDASSPASSSEVSDVGNERFRQALELIAKNYDGYQTFSGTDCQEIAKEALSNKTS